MIAARQNIWGQPSGRPHDLTRIIAEPERLISSILGLLSTKLCTQ